ncbi:MAG: hypothetical protein NTW16_05795 [Bacteroidetes bacterium]|nr:hypothetical protein [Bacteroidota bacterium]
MPLQKAPLKQGIANLMKDMMDRTDPSYDEFADRLSTLIETYVKTGTVTVALGIPVSTAGSPTAQTGSTTATGTGTIS